MIINFFDFIPTKKPSHTSSHDMYCLFCLFIIGEIVQHKKTLDINKINIMERYIDNKRVRLMYVKI